MLKQLIIKNFQSHVNTKLKLCGGVNAIVSLSTSNVGKTSILRAFLWLKNNRPVGTSFIRDGQKQAKVIGKVVGPDGRLHKIIRAKGKAGGKNYYRVGKTKYEAIGQSVPDEVQSLLRLSDLNIQDQLAPHFLILDPPSQVAANINKAIKLDEGNELVKRLTKRMQETKKNIVNLADVVRDKYVLLRDPTLKKLDKFEKRIAAITRMSGEMASKRQGIVVLSNLIKELGDLEEIKSRKVCPITMRNIRTAEIEYANASKEVNVLSLSISELQALINQTITAQFNLKKERKKHKQKIDAFVKLVTDLDVCPFCKQKIPSVKHLLEICNDK